MTRERRKFLQESDGSGEAAGGRRSSRRSRLAAHSGLHLWSALVVPVSDYPRVIPFFEERNARVLIGLMSATRAAGPQ